jgi:hypothetical protein
LLPQALWLALVLGLVAGPLCYSTDPLLGLLGLDAATHAEILRLYRTLRKPLPES